MFSKVKKHVDPNNKNTNIPISVIICGRNESENIQKYLPLILTQDYPEFEVIFVNDSSEDDSDLYLSVLKKKYSNFYYTTIPSDKKFIHSKKLAINIGIKAAKHDHLLFTDADCQPTSDQWIKQMATGFSNSNKELIIGYSPFEKRKGLLNCLIRYDSFWNGVQYLSYAIKGKAYMGVGRNLAYTKSLFKRNNGFNKFNNIISGDDDLFINQFANKNNTSVVISSDSQMVTTPSKSFGDWHRQKLRHLSTAPFYKTIHKIKLINESLSRQILWFAAIYSVFFHNFVIIACGFLIVKLIVQLVILKGAAKKVNEGKIYWSALIFDFLLPIILFIFHTENRFRSKQIKWK